jgi:heat shock protein HslJ
MQLRYGLAIASIALAGCLSSACASVPSAADVPSLDGTAWVLSALPGRTLLPGTTTTLRFEAGQASGTDGCNRYAAPYTASGATLQVERHGAATQMACPPAVMQQADAFMAGLTAARSYRVADGQLQLLAADGAVLARLTPQPQGVAGTSWRVIGYNNGKQAVTSVLGGTTLTLEFAADGRAGGSAGCNSYSAAYTSSGSAMSFGPAAATRMMCETPPGIMEQEYQFLQALATVATARQEGDRLELRTAAGALAVSLVREHAH